MSQSLIINLCMSVYILLVLFLWRTLIQNQKVNIFRFVGNVVSAIDIQLCCCHSKRAIDKT